MPMRLRTHDQAQEFFERLEPVEPDIVQVRTRRPDGAGEKNIRDEDTAMYGAVARQP
ncbi:hypothetical protein LK07_01850 [Streptomyces pluripotens]|uniref:Uncharacterized protein n=1 Tax=Streptomyces pluripotens TaxID=1355015 RepID=A0A221NSL6_9ACTN|nr:hypothetical protein LK06_000765 [Streptomyces pluripotens]ASN22969.1 hypothetical protein LK07_01850 [Streptomyces pluripotens]MCH0558560.1 SAM-dependent methyltransferase [Streptomyces sp. MUM 16J]